MVDSQPVEEEIRGTDARGVGTETHGGPTEPVLEAQKAPSPSSAFIKENIDVLRTMIKEHDQQAKTKATPRRLAESDKEAPARKRISEKRMKNQAKTDKTKHGMEKRGKAKVKSKPKSNQSQSPRKTKSTVKTGADTEEYLMGPPEPI
ncbi:hypothetical protein Tco_0421067 [Tanacetum coccineum]